MAEERRGGRFVRAENCGGQYVLHSEDPRNPADWLEIRVPSADADLAWRLLGWAMGTREALEEDD